MTIIAFEVVQIKTTGHCLRSRGNNKTCGITCAIYLNGCPQLMNSHARKQRNESGKNIRQYAKLAEPMDEMKTTNEKKK